MKRLCRLAARIGRTAVASLAGLAGLAACSPLPPVVSPTAAVAPPVRASTTTPSRDATPPDLTVRETILPGRPQPPSAPAAQPARARIARGGPVQLDFPNVDVQAVAKAVLGDVLGVAYTISPDIHSPVTLQPGRRLPRAEVLPAFEAALQTSGLALVAGPAGAYAILPVEQARAAAPVGGDAGVGFASEVVTLRFVNAEELRRLIDPVLPGVVTGADPATNTLTIAGTEGQRAGARDLVRQFDVDWLRGTSFALFIPRRTDSRLIVPELDKVLNADGAPTRNLVRLIALDRLNGILAVSTQPQYLDDVRRWVEVLDREGESNQRRLFVYRVQNGRAGDLARTLAGAFGQGPSGPGARSGPPGFGDSQRPPGVIGVLPSDAQSAGQGFNAPSSGLQNGASGAGPGSGGPGSGGLGSGGLGSGGLGSGGLGSGGASESSGGGGIAGLNPGANGSTIDVQADDFHAKITSDEINNAIVVYATPRDYAVIEDALRKLDIAPYEVVIEAAITEVTLTDALRFGVQGLYNNHGVSAGLTESAASAVPIQDFPGFSAFYAAKSITAALNALENLTTIKVVSAPKLMVLNNQTASIEVGDQVPILTGSATSVITSDAPVVNSVDYRDTGIILKVTPRVNSSGYVLLDMAQEVSDVVPAGSSSTIDSPTFSTRRIATSIAVQDGEVIALGGLIRDSRQDSKNGLPVLSRIPVLGPLLFGNIQNSDTRTELIVLLRPTVVRNADDGRAVTEELRDKLKGLRGLLPDRNIP